MTMERYDAIIIGSGLGGLACGATLSREGMKVCVLERHRTIGGCLQSFRRAGRLLDTGMHYVGSLAPGQILHQYFKYYGVVERLQLEPLDPEAYDVIRFGEERYAYACGGSDRFVERLVEQFPGERRGIEAYGDLLRRVGRTISPEVLRSGRLSTGGHEYMGLSAAEAIASCTPNPKLRRVLAGTTLLHSRDRVRTSLYEHAMIHHSYAESAWRFVGGTQHVADALADAIRRNGGEVRADAEVTRLAIDGRKVAYVEVNGAERLAGRYVVSAIHPANTLDLLEGSGPKRPALARHIRTLDNSYGLFTTYLVMRSGGLPYVASNFHLHPDGSDGWTPAAADAGGGGDLPVVLLGMQPDPTHRWADSVSLLVPVRLGETDRWDATTVGRRGEDYAAWKERYTQASIDFVTQYFPTLRAQIETVYTASPLTWRDYTATPGGSAYGIVKDCRNPMLSHLPVRTRIENLLLTGQNLNLHGALGVCVSAAATCCALLGEEYLTKKIGYE